MGLLDLSCCDDTSGTSMKKKAGINHVSVQESSRSSKPGKLTEAKEP